MFNKNVLLLSLLLLATVARAKFFDFNQNCQQAYQEIFALRLENGRSRLNNELDKNPDNLIPVYLESYVDFLAVFCSRDESDFNRLKDNRTERIAQLKSGPVDSPYYLYTQAEVYLHNALAKLMFKEYISGTFELRRAYKLLEENIALYPDFLPNKKSYYTIMTILGIVPSKYDWGLKLLGMRGALTEGLGELKQLSRQDFLFQAETTNIYASLLFHLTGNSKDAWDVIQKAGYPVENNLFTYYNAGEIALYAKHNEQAIDILQHAPNSPEYPKFPVMNYYLGLAYLNQLDTSARQYFLKFIQEDKGNDLIKSAYQKIAWSYLVQGNDVQYVSSIKKVLDNGRAEIDTDVQAQEEAEGNHPNALLLKARLLFDGGYYEKALELLNEKDENDFNEPKYKLEYIYRKARIYDEDGEKETAKKFYERTIEKGFYVPVYYAANAALNLGLVYESEGNKELAAYYFKKCLETGDHEYKSSLDLKAKAGLERLKN